MDDNNLISVAMTEHDWATIAHDLKFAQTRTANRNAQAIRDQVEFTCGLRPITASLIEPLYQSHNLTIAATIKRDTCEIIIKSEPITDWATSVVLRLSECTPEYVASTKSDLESIIPERHRR